MVTLAILGCVLFAFALCARKLDGTVVTAPMVFVSGGLLAGWTGLLEFGSATEHAGAAPTLTREVVLVVAEVALVLIVAYAVSSLTVIRMLPVAVAVHSGSA